MRKVVVTNHVTLDGVMQAPGRPDEDVRGGFAHGGWAVARNDAVMGRVMGEGMAQGGPLLFGRRTYEDFYGFWPNQKDNPFTEVLDNTQKYVASTRLKKSRCRGATRRSSRATPWTRWQSSRSSRARTSACWVAESWSQSLMRHNLVDTYVLMIHPLVLGSGRRLFPDGSPLAPLRLVDSVTTTTGVLIATYEPTGSTTHTRR